MDRLLSSDDLCKLLKYPTADALQRPNLTEDEKYELIDTQIFGYRFVPQAVDTKKSFISLGMGGFVPQESFRQFSMQYIMGVVYFYILIDVDIMKTDNGYRNDLLLAEVNKLFQASTFMGIGETKLFQMDELWQQSNKFGGYQVGYEVDDLR